MNASMWLLIPMITLIWFMSGRNCVQLFSIYLFNNLFINTLFEDYLWEGNVYNYVSCLSHRENKSAAVP